VKKKTIKILKKLTKLTPKKNWKKTEPNQQKPSQTGKNRANPV
jgi:hypothetical protein